jgi:small-conductance mechanosensitive channel
MDLRERHQLDVTARMQKVRARARPWRSILALVLAIAGAIAAEASGVGGLGRLHAAGQSHRLVYICGLGAFFILGLAASLGLAARVQSTSRSLIGQAHAGVLRYALVLIGFFAVLTFSLAIARIDVRQLLVSGAVLGVIVGIAAQQSLANLFAGLVLMFAHPFRVGSHVRFRAGALGGQMEGFVSDVGLTYVRLETDEGPALLPNAQALAAAIMTVPEHGPTGNGAAGSRTSGAAAGPSSPPGSPATGAAPNPGAN